MNRRLNRSLLALVAAVVFSAATPAQEGTALTVTPYTPKAFTSDTLLNTASALFGAQITVAADPAGAQPPNGSSTMPHFVQLGELLLIRDTPAMSKQIVATLEALEAQEGKRQKEIADAEERRRKTAGAESGDVDDFTATQSVEIRPRYVSFETLVAALKPFERKVRYAQEGAHGWNTFNLNPIASGNLIVVCETATRLKSLLELVDRVDQPRPQMSISVMLVQPSGVADGKGDPTGKGGKALPKELVANLRALLPEQEFALLSMGMLRCSAQSGQQCELKMNLANGGNWSLSFFPDAFDAKSGELSLTHCNFHSELPTSGAHPAIQEFDTSLTLKSGEYVVLGAIGADPTFVVLRAEPIRKAQ